MNLLPRGAYHIRPLLKCSLVLPLFLLLLATQHAAAQQKLLDKADQHLVSGDTSKALKVLNRGIKKYNTAAALYLHRARIKIDRKDYAPAMIDLNTFCSLNTTCDTASFLKGLILYRQGNYHGAITHFSEYTRQQESARGWLYLGLSHMALQNYQVAVHSFEKAIAAKPADVKAWYNAGLSAFRAGDYTAADSLLSGAMTLAPKDKEVLLARALTAYKQARFTESNRLLMQLLDTTPSDHTALYNLGVNYYSMDEQKLACDYWMKAAQAGSPAAQVAISEYCEGK